MPEKVETGHVQWQSDCDFCNGAKGSNAAGYDPESGQLVRLFNPRTEAWDAHFVWEGPMLRGRTPEARTTIEVLRINDPARVEHRRLLMAAGLGGAES